MANPSRTELKAATAAKNDDAVVGESGGGAAQGDFSLTEDRVRTAIQAARTSAEEARRALQALELEATGKFGETQKQVEQAIREKPMQAAGVAFALGVLATLFLRRR